MRITKRQLKRIIKEEKAKLMEYGGRPYDPMEYPEGMNTRGYNPVTGDIPQGYTEEDMHYDDYISWAKKNGHLTPASSSVLATYVVDSGLDEPVWLSIASDVGIDALDVRMDIARQQAEQSVTMGESRITKRRLRRIIKEAADEAMTNDEIEALEIIEEMGYNHDLPITHMENQTAIRDAMAGYPEWVTYETIESAVKKEALNIARRPVLDPAMLEILYELTPADEMEGWDDDPGLWAAVAGDFYPDSEVAWLWAGSPAGWVRFGIYEEDIWDMDETGLDFFNWMNKQGANVQTKKGPAPKKLMHMLSMG